MYDTYMSTPGNTAKLGATHSSIQTAQRGPSLVGSEPAMHKSVHNWVSTLPTMPARHEGQEWKPEILQGCMNECLEKAASIGSCLALR